jgi:hypothetical protein
MERSWCQWVNFDSLDSSTDTYFLCLINLYHNEITSFKSRADPGDHFEIWSLSDCGNFKHKLYLAVKLFHVWLLKTYTSIWLQHPL